MGKGSQKQMYQESTADDSNPKDFISVLLFAYVLGTVAFLLLWPSGSGQKPGIFSVPLYMDSALPLFRISTHFACSGTMPPRLSWG